MKNKNILKIKENYGYTKYFKKRNINIILRGQ
jgi:hypothetical protein